MRSQAPADLKGSITFKEKVIKKAKTALIINQDPKVILLNIVWEYKLYKFKTKKLIVSLINPIMRPPIHPFRFDFMFICAQSRNQFYP